MNAYDEGYADGLVGNYDNPYELATPDSDDYDDGYFDGDCFAVMDDYHG